MLADRPINMNIFSYVFISIGYFANFSRRLGLAVVGEIGPVSRHVCQNRGQNRFRHRSLPSSFLVAVVIAPPSVEPSWNREPWLPKVRLKLTMALHESTEENVRKHLEGVSLHEDFNPELEPLLQEDPNRLRMSSDQYRDMWVMYEKGITFFWTVDDVLFCKLDKMDWDQKLNSDERYFIFHVLAFFAASDVNKKLIEKFIEEVKIIEAFYFYGLQVEKKKIHFEMYSLLVQTYISDPKEIDLLFNAIHTLPSVAKKANWALKWINHESVTFPERVVAFAAIEGIFFSGSFAYIFWLKKRGIMGGLTDSCIRIWQDKGLHYEFACLMFKHIVQKPSSECVKSIIMDAVKIEKEFLMQAFRVKLIGMNCTLMCNYIEFVADRLFVALGFEKVYNSENPFSFMDFIEKMKSLCPPVG